MTTRSKHWLLNAQRGVAASVVASVPFLASAYAVSEMTFEERLSQSQLVIVGTAGTEEAVSTVETYTHVNVQFVLKGQPPADVLVLTKDPVRDGDPDCCVAGETYLFLLIRMPNGRYASVNGRFGVYRLP